MGLHGDPFLLQRVLDDLNKIFVSNRLQMSLKQPKVALKDVLTDVKYTFDMMVTFDPYQT